jgi:nucleoside-diphosphate-sugar epimerase
MNKTILITGIGGFIGLRAAEIALERGFQVRGLQHSANKARKAEQLGADVVVGSITDPVAAEKACQGVDIILHTAAIVKENETIERCREVNVGGTVNMAKAAKKAGVKTFVHLSSVMVYGFNYPDRITESGLLRGENNPYCQTKIEAEKAILPFNSPPEFGVIIIRPGDVYGAGSTPWIVRPLELMRQGSFMLANQGRGVINHVYIDNLIDAIFLAIEKEAYGEIFNITDGKETSWKEYYDRLARIAQLKPPASLPASILKGLIRLQCLFQKAIGQKPEMMPDSIDFITRPHAYSIDKAIDLLNYQPKIDLAEGMRRTQVWLQQTKSNNS